MQHFLLPTHMQYLLCLLMKHTSLVSLFDHLLHANQGVLEPSELNFSLC